MLADTTLRLLTIATVSLWFDGRATAQRLVPGYVILIAGDSLPGAIRLSSPIEQQREVKFVPLAANQLLKFSPEKVRAYGYMSAKDTVRYVACPVQLGYPVVYRTKVAGQDNTFIEKTTNDTVWLLLKQVMAGPVQLYERYDSHNGAPSLRQYFLRKGHNLPVNTYWWNFPKDAAVFFKDHSALTAQLQTKHYHARDLKTVVHMYNKWQLATTKPIVQ
ncbi:hypothetical protein [uncultured Hymenobacter sp.]|uniref:hypothetical protein n=1 Tax=uncultured Hymenobacter sp. TaxID=170016 RepID=UPI0035CB3BE0